MRTAVTLLLLPIISLATVHAAPNQQVYFKRKAGDGSITYEYHWHDHSNTLRKVMFSIDSNELQKLPQSQAHYLPNLVRQYIKTDLTRYAKTIDPRQARVTIQEQNNGLSVGVRSDDPSQVEALHKMFKEKENTAFLNYLQDNYFEQFKSPNGPMAVKTNHIRYINEYKALFMPIARAFYAALGNAGSPRDFVNLVISWTQSIPYSELSGRGESNGAGFLPPTSLMDANIGDCDSKSVLAATIIKNFLPSAELHLVILPKHALLAISTSPRESDIKVQGKYREVVLFEPTGPAPLALGELAPTSLQYIQGQKYTLQVIE